MVGNTRAMILASNRILPAPPSIVSSSGESRKSASPLGPSRAHVKKKTLRRKKLRQAPEADNFMSVAEMKAVRVKFAYKNVCSFCHFRGRNFTQTAYHIAYKCKLPLTNQMIHTLLKTKRGGKFRITRSREMDASGVSNKSLQRMFDGVDLPRNVMIAPVHYMYLWVGPGHKGKSRKCTDLRRKRPWGRSRIDTFKRDVGMAIHENKLDFVAIPVSFYPTRKWHQLIGMTHSAMILIKLRHIVNGNIQATYYESFDPTKSDMFCKRVVKSDVRLTLKRLVGRNVSITKTVVWPSPVSRGCNAVTAYWGLTLGMGYPDDVDGTLPMPKSDGTIADCRLADCSFPETAGQRYTAPHRPQLYPKRSQTPHSQVATSRLEFKLYYIPLRVVLANATNIHKYMYPFLNMERFDFNHSTFLKLT